MANDPLSRMPPPSEMPVIGLAWFLKQDYPAILDIMADADQLPVDFEKWLYRSQKVERDRKAQGYRVARAIIDPATFPAWCKDRGLNVDAAGRMAFAADYAYRHGRH